MPRRKKSDPRQLPLWPEAQFKVESPKKKAKAKKAKEPKNVKETPDTSGPPTDEAKTQTPPSSGAPPAPISGTSGAPATPTEPTVPPDLTARAVGGLLGLACGDALGAPIEFKNLATVRETYGTVTDMIGGGIWAPGEWTDDTGMAICIAEGILEDPKNPVPGSGERFLAWARTAKDVGGTISAALSRFRTLEDWAKASSSTPQATSGRAAGNGSLMRTLPVALAYAEPSEMLRQSARLSSMTHWDPQAELCCAIYCLWIRALLDGASIADGWQTALAETKEVAKRGILSVDTVGPSPLPEGFWERLNKVTDIGYEDLQPSGYAGYSVECLEAAAWCAIFSPDAEQAIIDVVNLAGESDTMGAVCGGVVGTYYGVDALPRRWLENLLDRKRIEKLARGLVEVRGQS